MFERYTERARQTVVLAQDEARSIPHGYIGTEHLLLGLIREEQGIAARALENLGIRYEHVRMQVDSIEHASEPLVGQIPFTPRAKKALERSLREALSLGHNYVGTEHLLLGINEEDDGVGAKILRQISTKDEVKEEIITLLLGKKRTAQPQSKRPEIIKFASTHSNALKLMDVLVKMGYQCSFTIYGKPPSNDTRINILYDELNSTDLEKIMELAKEHFHTIIFSQRHGLTLRPSIILKGK